MNKIPLIIQREYLTRVRKKSFIIMSLLTPILVASIFMVPLFLATLSDEKKVVAVIDESNMIGSRIKNSENVDFVFVDKSQEETRKELKKGTYSAVLVISGNVLKDSTVTIYHTEKQPSINVVGYVESEIQKQIESDKLLEAGVNQDVINRAKVNIKAKTVRITDKGEETSSSGASTIIGYVCGVLIYFFIFLYGAQVMRGVIEEKSNRIVEVIISSVKPFQLMMGKVIGIGLVALTQFLLWIVLTFTINTVVANVFLKGKMEKVKAVKEQQIATDPSGSAVSEKGNLDILNIPSNINVLKILLLFTFYFVGGYLLYASLFAAIGAAVDSEADTQQFMLPITIPLILSFMVAQYVITSPDGPIAFWFSVIPFTSPIVMIVRVAFDAAPLWELALSMSLLVLGFLGTTWLAGRIYRTGILMYGKKPTYKEIGKWLFYKG